MLTRQEIFSKAYLHAKSMKLLAIDLSYEEGNQAHRSCRYQAKNGERCLIGSFIPDEKYTPAMEGFNVARLSESHEYKKVFTDLGINLEKDSDRMFILCLQHCHDAAHDIPDMFKNLESFAETHGLSIPE